MAVASPPGPDRGRRRGGASFSNRWASPLFPGEYTRFALPSTRRVLEGIADLGVPTILYGVGTGELLAPDGHRRIRRGRRRLAGPPRRGAPACGRHRTPLQGNLDPALCLAPWPVVAEATRGVLTGAADGTGTGHVFNLGHGVLPETDPAILAAVVDLVHEETGRA